MNRNLVTRISIVAIAIALIGGVALASASTAATPGRYITVSADGTVKVAPDAVRLNATISVVAGTSKEALAATSTSATAVRAALIANGIATKDIATQSLTVYPEYNYTQNKSPVIIGYRGSQSFNVVIHNAKNAGLVVDAVVAAGGDNLQINGVTPFVFDSTKATASARTDAVKKAKAKASSYASLLDVKLGKVNYLIENSAPTPYPQPMRDFAPASAAGATQVDLGQQDVTVSITIQWALR
jgi:uncharacterized protein YggE